MAYYADRHFGICLGFEISTHVLIPVHYKTKRLPFPYLEELSFKDWQKSVVMPFVSTKAESWKHEKERRMLVTLSDCVLEGDTYYYPFNINVKLEEVILGHKFVLRPETEIPKLPPYAKLFRATLSASDFAIERIEIHKWPAPDA